ncbi:MAG: hypothetical protein JWQ09_5820 [Segetibacter sp.]|nr:hypothetical protein [Segetibacter sp.]
MNTNPKILSGKVCPYCGENTTHCSDSVIYNRTYGGMVYLCLTCDAYVGCHKPNPTQSLGRLANADLRSAKIAAHASFDTLWRKKISRDHVSKSKARKAAYRWLSCATGIPVEYCHIGFMDIEECNKVIEVCKPFLK